MLNRTAAAVIVNATGALIDTYLSGFSFSGGRIRRPPFLVIAALAILAFPAAINAQTTGSLSGTVLDPTGAVIYGASVKVRSNSTGEERTATSNDNGVFNLTQLQPGSYSITVTSKNFKTTVVPNIKVDVAAENSVSIALEIGGVGETVIVTGVQDVINTTSPSLTNTINTRQVQDLPLPDRNALGLAALQAGIAVIGTETRALSIAGLRQTAVTITQDGINAMDNHVKTFFFAVNAPALNSTAEFSITTGTVGSEAGRGAAQVTLVTRGGTNDVHGGLFFQRINDAQNANTFFNNFNGIAKPILRQHYLGFDIGGPVHFLAFGEGVNKHWVGKDKAFFFFSFEAFRQTLQVNRNRVVLTRPALNGTFQYVGTNGVLQTVDLLSLGSIHTPSPFMTSYLARIPPPNNFNCSASDGFNIGCYGFNVTETNSNNKYVGRYDHQLVKHSGFGSHKFEFVYSRTAFVIKPDVITDAIEAPFPGGVNAFQASKRYLLTPALVSIFGDHITNVFRYGRQWAPFNFLRESNPTFPLISLPGALTSYDNTALSGNQVRNTTVNQITDTLSWAKGNHLLKFGGDLQKIFTDTFNDAGIFGSIVLGSNPSNGTGLTLSNVPFSTNVILSNANTVYSSIVGLLASYSQTFNVESPTSGFVPGYTRRRMFQEKDIALFAQDQWRFRSNFTLNFGLRWDLMGVPTVPNGLAIQPAAKDIFGISGFGNLFTPNAAPGSQTRGVATQQFVSGTTGIGLYKNDWNNFAPFFGFAYSPRFKKGPLHILFGEVGKTSIRAGYSISYLHDGFTTISNALGTGTTNPGLIQTLSNNAPIGVITSAAFTFSPPNFQIPITDRQNFLLSSSNGIWAIDPGLRIPYVQQWSFGIEREILKETALEVRYKGNHAIKVWRAFDYNEVNIFENGFLLEFLNAQRNLTARGGGSFAPGCTGCVGTPLLDKFFAGLPATSGYSSSTFIASLTANNVGTMASTLAFSPTYRMNRENPANGIPANFFVANPNAAFARLLSNDAMSNYNALEVELRRRFSEGLQFQADYTFSKALGNAVDAQGNNQSDLVTWRTLRAKRLDYRRSTQDQTHRFVANALYELPFGKGKMFFNTSSGLLDRAINGWTLGVIVVWSTSPPWYVAAGRTTFNSFNPGNNPAELVGITFEDFKKNVGLFKTPGGVFFINPDILNITYDAAGKVLSSTLKPGLMSAPAPGTFGNFPLNSIDGPNYFDVDMSLTKRIPITEKVWIEVKATAINLLNHPNFVYGAQNFDSTTFGLITSQRGSARQMNFIGSIRF